MIALRHLACLGFVAGYIAARAFLDLGGIVAGAMTGNTTAAAIALSHADWPQLSAIVYTIGVFIAACLGASLLRRLLPHPALELYVMVVLLAAAQLVHITHPHPARLELTLLIVTLAMQGETTSTFAGRQIQTIVVTNTLIKFADAAVALILPLIRRTALPEGAWLDAILPGTAWLAFAAGSATAVNTWRWAFLLPMALLCAVGIDMLVKSDKA